MSNKSEHRMNYDLLVIGAGTAGKSAALKAVSLGARTAIIETGWICRKNSYQ